MNRYSNQKLYIYYFSVGSGHQRAAEAIYTAMKEACPNVEITISDPFSKKVRLIPPLMELSQIIAITLFPRLYTDIWEQGDKNLIKLTKNLEFLQRIMANDIDKSKKNIVISTHGLPCLIASSLKNKKIISKVYGIVTDYAIHSFWKYAAIDGFFVGHTELADKLINQGIHPDTIHVTGIPITEKFQFLLGSSTHTQFDNVRVLFVAGGLRGSSYIEIERSAKDIIDLFETIGNNFRLSIICGNNNQLLNVLTKIQQKSKLELTLYGYVSNMSEILAEQDIIVTKPGGLIIAESLATGLGIILLKAGPGQEAVNSEFLLRHKAALPGDTMEKLYNSLQLLQNHDELRRIKQQSRLLGKPNAATIISEIIKGEMVE